MLSVPLLWILLQLLNNQCLCFIPLGVSMIPVLRVLRRIALFLSIDSLVL